MANVNTTERPPRKERTKMFKEGLHWCDRCKEYLSVDAFFKRSKVPYGLSYSCKQCYNSPSTDREPIRTRMRRYQKRKKRALVKLAGGACQRCGYNEFVAGLSFHHLDPKEKDIRLAAVNIHTAKREVDKCIMLCITCHFTYHAYEWDAEFVKREGLGWTIGGYKLPAIRRFT